LGGFWVFGNPLFGNHCFGNCGFSAFLGPPRGPQNLKIRPNPKMSFFRQKGLLGQKSIHEADGIFLNFFKKF
jgi:hypothetical protein